jgi:hypothetical protein
MGMVTTWPIPMNRSRVFTRQAAISENVNYDCLRHDVLCRLAPPPIPHRNGSCLRAFNPCVRTAPARLSQVLHALVAAFPDAVLT